MLSKNLERFSNNPHLYFIIDQSLPLPLLLGLKFPAWGNEESFSMIINIRMLSQDGLGYAMIARDFQISVI